MYLNDLLYGQSAEISRFLLKSARILVSGQIKMLDTLKFAYLKAKFLRKLNSDSGK